MSQPATTENPPQASMEDESVRFATGMDPEGVKLLFWHCVRMGADFRDIAQEAKDWLDATYGPTVVANTQAQVLPNVETMKCAWKAGRLAMEYAFSEGAPLILKKHLEFAAQTIQGRAQDLRGRGRGNGLGGAC